MTIRIGSGYDVHAFAPHRPLVLSGVTIPHELGLAGHSDADAVIHAIVDALLGAAALGDIGQHFPSHDARWKDQPSAVFLDYTLDLLCQQGWSISNIDATIIAERPRMDRIFRPCALTWLSICAWRSGKSASKPPQPTGWALLVGGKALPVRR